MGRKVHGNHGRDHKPSKYGTTTAGGSDPTEGMLYLPSAAETDGQVLTRDSAAPHGIKWADAGGGGNLPWARRRLVSGSDQSINSTSETNVTLDSFATDYASYYEAYDNGSIDAIKVLQDGLYAILARIYWVSWPGDNQLTLNGVDPDAWAGYSFAGGDVSNTLVTTGAMTTRLAEDAIIYMTAYHAFGSAKSIEGSGGTYIEIVRIGDVTVTGRNNS